MYIEIEFSIYTTEWSNLVSIIFDIFSLQLVLASVLNAFYDAVSQMLRKNVEKRYLMEHLDAIFLAIDELVDEG